MISNFALQLLANILFLFSALVLQNPADTSQEPGEWAEFTCSVACSHSINWFVEGYVGDITTACSAVGTSMMVCKTVTQQCSSPTSTFGYSETLRVLAKPELASTNIAVQCAAVSRSAPNTNNCPPFLAYSRYALLSGKFCNQILFSLVLIQYILCSWCPTNWASYNSTTSSLTVTCNLSIIKPRWILITLSYNMCCIKVYHWHIILMQRMMRIFYACSLATWGFIPNASPVPFKNVAMVIHGACILL